VQLRRIDLKQFRCFKKLNLCFEKQVVLITGPNGSGKTTILEALHYLGYLRSFRSPTPQNLVNYGQNSFFLKVALEDDVAHETEIQAGFSEGKRLVRVNKRQVRSYKELIDHYRVVTITEDDLDIIKGGPSIRRAFIDQVVLHKDPEFIQVFRKYRNTLENRNTLLKQRSSDEASLNHWTELLWKTSAIIQQRRIETLGALVVSTNKLLKDNFNQKLSITFSYNPKITCDQKCYENFIENHCSVFVNEQRYGRSLFGTHLDDISIEFQEKKSKIYASRGQQKLTVLLLKIAQLQNLTALRGPCLLLLDDFMTDFDHERGSQFINIIVGMGTQAIFVSPVKNGIFEEMLLKRGAQLIELNSNDQD